MAWEGPSAEREPSCNCAGQQKADHAALRASHVAATPLRAPTGYASNVYKAFCKYSGETVCLKSYTLGNLCDLNRFQVSPRAHWSTVLW